MYSSQMLRAYTHIYQIRPFIWSQHTHVAFPPQITKKSLPPIRKGFFISRSVDKLLLFSLLGYCFGSGFGGFRVSQIIMLDGLQIII